MLDHSFEVDSFLTDIEVNTLLKFYGTFEKQLNSGDNKMAYTSGFKIANTPVKDFQSRLHNIFGEFNVTVSMFLEEFDPWSVHTDFLKADKKPYFAVLIPLEYDNDTHTVVFNEVGTSNEWKQTLGEKTGFSYDQDHLKLLSHVDRNLLTKLSIRKIYKWKKGNIIAWHRSLLHSSDNFKINGTEKKTALVLFLNQDD